MIEVSVPIEKWLACHKALSQHSPEETGSATRNVSMLNLFSHVEWRRKIRQMYVLQCMSINVCICFGEVKIIPSVPWFARCTLTAPQR
jgi:hypothetical protein